MKPRLRWRSPRERTCSWPDRRSLAQAREWAPPWKGCAPRLSMERADPKGSSISSEKGAHMQIGMAGLGRMGANMARRLLKGGHRCVVFNRSPKPVEELVKEKAT